MPSDAPETFRRLCNSAWLQGQYPRSSADVKHEVAVTSQQCPSLGQAGENEFTQLISTSFQQAMREVLPNPQSDETSLRAPGGYWFWETYRHALFGENVIVRLGGTGISLAEDFLASQAELRAKVCATYASSSAQAQGLLAHGSAKLEVLYALSLSVALHVAKLPVLDRAQGPRAVVLCATHLQCTEFTAVLNVFCPSLHLVVHNLFDAYPSLPVDKRADVVVGTPPLWESVAQLDGGASAVSVDAAARLGGLEDVLVALSGGSQPPPAYNLSRWRPYSLANVEQLVLFDVELQVNMGFASILQHIVRTKAAPSSPNTKGNPLPLKGKLPPLCQQYVVLGEDRWQVDHDAVRLLVRTIHENGRAFASCGTASIALSLENLPRRCDLPRKRPHDSEAKEDVPTAQQRCVEAEDVPNERRVVELLEPSQAHWTTATQSGNGFDGLLIRNALSHARLHADFAALTDFKSRLIDMAEEFWLRFEGVVREDACELSSAAGEGRNNTANEAEQTTAKAPASVLHAVQIDLAMVCVKLDSIFELEEKAADCSNAAATHRAQELGVWVHAIPEECSAYASRLALLWRHLFDKLNGELFDGSVVHCILAEDAFRLSYSLCPLLCRPNCAARLLQSDAFSYGPNLLKPTLLEITKRSAEEEAKARAERARERRRLTAGEFGENYLQRLVETGLPWSFFLFSSTDRMPSKRVSESSHLLVPADAVTVIVLRRLLVSRVEVCGGEKMDDSDALDDKESPLVLRVLEECCQYGRVLSYYVHEDATRSDPHEPHQMESYSSAAAETTSKKCISDKEATQRKTHSTAVSIFVEFTSSDSAIEATHQFALRFAAQAARTQKPEYCSPRVYLFRNDTYYQGVKQEISHAEQQDCHASDDGDDSDSLFDDFIGESLLAE